MMKGERFVALYLVTLAVSMLSAIEALQCYVCDNCIEGEEFNVLEICGANGGAIIPVLPSSTLATTTTTTSAETTAGTAADTKKPLVVVNVSEPQSERPQTDNPQEIAQTTEPPVTVLPTIPTTTPTNTDDKALSNTDYEYSYEDVSEQEQPIEQSQQQQQQPEQTETQQQQQQQQTEQNRPQQQQQQESVPITTTRPQTTTPTTVMPTTTTNVEETNTIMETEGSNIVNGIETTKIPLTLSPLVDSEEDNSNNNNENEYDDDQEENEKQQQNLTTNLTILLKNQTSSTANNTSVELPSVEVDPIPDDHDEDYYNGEYDEDYDEERMQRPQRRPSLRQQMPEPVCYVIQMEVNNSQVTKRGCASLVRNELNGEFLCHEIFPGANVEECYLCESNGCNKVKFGSAMSKATTSPQQRLRGLLFMMIMTAAIVG